LLSRGVIYAEMATGPYDVIARGRVPNLHDLDLLPELLKRLDGVLRAPTGDARGRPVKVLAEARSVRMMR
jgi:DNA-binding Lrp family transcriptional regulator